MDARDKPGHAGGEAVGYFSAFKFIPGGGYLLILQIVAAQACLFRDSGEHARADFIPVVESKDKIGRARALQSAVRSTLAFDRPADPQKRREHALCFGGGPAAHAI